MPKKQSAMSVEDLLSGNRGLGNLLAALNKQQPDESLIAGARDIIRALIAGGPAEDISDYKDGPEVFKCYLRQAMRLELGIADYLAAANIHKFVNDAAYDWSSTAGEWSSEVKNEISEYALSILERPDWQQKIEADLKSDDNVAFYSANQAAKHLGIDTWSLHLEKIKADPKKGNWWEVMQTNDVERIQKIIDAASDLLPLHEIASGASDSLGLGPRFWAHSALGFILQDLGKCPGKGWKLIKVGLQSPVVRNRNMALNALDAWPKETWPGDVSSALSAALQNEVDEKVIDRISKLIAGQKLDA